MGWMLWGLVLFLGAHSMRIVAEPLRQRLIDRLGLNAYKGLYSLVSAAGLAAIVWGFGQARLSPVVLWASPVFTRHLSVVLMVPSMVLLVAAYVPRNVFKRRWGHPMLIGTAIWAAAHLMANNTLADMLLFGGFLVWSLSCLASARRRTPAPDANLAAPGHGLSTALSVVLGVGAWAVLVFWAHAAWIGVSPLGTLK